MKKVLVGSSALIAAGAMAASPAAAAEGVKLGLGGYYNAYFAVVDNDEASGDGRDFGPTGIFNEGEVHFKGSTTLDNGITIGVQIELEVNGSGDRIDEHYAFISGSFGRLVWGDENTAAYLMQVAGPQVGIPINSGWVTSFVPPPNVAGTTTTLQINGTVMATGTQMTITTIGGGMSISTTANASMPFNTVMTTITNFVVNTNSTSMSLITGAAFRTPGLSTYVDLGNDDSAFNYYSPRFSGFQLGLSYAPVAQIDGEGANFPALADDNSEAQDLFAVGANFIESFGGLDVAIAGGYRRNENVGSAEDPEQWSGGLNLGFAGFTIGGSFAIEDSTRASDGYSFDAGLSYSTGPWSVGAYAFRSETEGSSLNSDNDEYLAISGGLSYSVGPGITASATVLYAEWEDEGGDDSEGIGGVVGMSIGF